MYGHTTVSSAVPTALYLAASAAALHDLADAARSFGDVSVAETAGGYRLSAAGLTLDLELVTDAAIALGRRLGKAATILTVMCDSGIKYLSTPLYAPAGR